MTGTDTATVRRVSPHPRGLVPQPQADELRAAFLAVKQAIERRDRAVLAALAAGGSYQETADVAGCAKTTVERIARRHGWPPRAVVEARQRQRDLTRRFEQELAQAKADEERARRQT